MPEYRVDLDAYHGPLDLMLFLVKRHEIDLYDIPIAELTDQYLAHVRQIERIDVELAGEFLVMAATLIEIKSRMLLPRPEDAADGEGGDALSELDPRFELVQQLLAYKQYKDAALQLDDRRLEWQQRFSHLPGKGKAPGAGAEDGDEDAELVEFDLEDANVIDLFEAFSRILESIGQSATLHEVVYDDTPVALHAEDIIDRLERGGEGATLTLQEIFVGRESRSEMIGLFLAMLELVNRKRVRVRQDKRKGEVRISLMPQSQQEEPATPTWRNPVTGEVQYDWPSKALREEFEQREARALERAQRGEEDAKAEEGEDVEVDKEAQAAEDREPEDDTVMDRRSDD